MKPEERKRLSFFERYLTLWVAACTIAGVLAGTYLPGFTATVRRLEFGKGSQINGPIAVLIWLMIYPMMLKIEYLTMSEPVARTWMLPSISRRLTPASSGVRIGAFRRTVTTMRKLCAKDSGRARFRIGRGLRLPPAEALPLHDRWKKRKNQRIRDLRTTPATGLLAREPTQSRRWFRVFRRNVMSTRRRAAFIPWMILGLTLVPIVFDAPALALEDDPLAAGVYAADFVSTAAFGINMNDAGDVIGTSYPDNGCGPFCLPPLETVVWRGGNRIVLPSVPGLSGITVRSINADGWIAGFAGFPGTTTHAVVWKPIDDTSYEAIDLGTLPGTTISDATGIDDLGRVIGWSTTSTFPPNGSPFLWTETGGMVDLSAEGFPDEQPLAMSPGGAVATPGYWYRVDAPGSAVPMPAAPQGFGVGSYPATINDFGDQVRFLVSTGPQNLVYPFRFHAPGAGSWQQISFAGTGHLSRYGVGSINDAGDATLTVQSTAQIASGPDGMAEPLGPLVSPAYQGQTVTEGGPLNGTGQILAQLFVGNSPRLVRLTPAQTCTSGCIRVSNLTVRAKFVQDPGDPGHCTQDGQAFNRATVTLTLTSETGARLPGVLVSGRILDDYWTNATVSGTTNSKGTVKFSYRGQCGVGAIAFLVDSATKSGLVFDRTMGVLSGSAVPQ